MTCSAMPSPCFPLPCFSGPACDRVVPPCDRAVPGAVFSALVEESALCDAGLVLRRDIDVSRRQQEHLLRHPFNAAMKTEDETRREVDKSLRIRVVHLREIHDHGRALTEVF